MCCGAQSVMYGRACALSGGNVIQFENQMHNAANAKSFNVRAERAGIFARKKQKKRREANMCSKGDHHTVRESNKFTMQMSWSFMVVLNGIYER